MISRLIERGNESERVLRLEDDDLEEPIPRVSRVRDGDLELDPREVDEKHAEALGSKRAAVYFQRDLRFLRHRVRDGCLEIRNSSQGLFCGSSIVHDRGIIACARHDPESLARASNLNLAQVEI